MFTLLHDQVHCAPLHRLACLLVAAKDGALVDVRDSLLRQALWLLEGFQRLGECLGVDLQHN